MEKQLQYLLFEFLIEQTDKFKFIPTLDHSIIEHSSHISHYEITSHILGEGRFGRVIEASNVKTNQKCAIKVINKRRILNLKAVFRMNNEIRILQKLTNHEHFIQLFDCFHSNNYFWLVFEAGTMSLYDYWKKENEILSLNQFLNIFGSIIRGILFLHNHDIAHRDLKLDNIVVFNSFLPHIDNGSKTLDSNLTYQQIKIIDFGLSLDETNLDEEGQTNISCGTVGYFAPENVFDSNVLLYPFPTDMWSLGCMLLQLLFGEHLFCSYWLPAYYDKSSSKIRCKEVLCDYLQEALKKINNYSHGCVVMIQTSNDVYIELCRLLFGMLQINVSERFTIQQLLSSVLFESSTERIFDDSFAPVRPTDNHKKTSSFKGRIARIQLVGQTTEANCNVHTDNPIP